MPFPSIGKIKWSTNGNIHFATILLVAEEAELHLEKHQQALYDLFASYHILPSDYRILVGFNDVIISRGLGYLEEIYIYSRVSIPQRLCNKLAALLSPFPVILHMPSSTINLPVIMPNGTIWDKDDLYITRTRTLETNKFVAFSDVEMGQEGRVSEQIVETPEDRGSQGNQNQEHNRRNNETQQNCQRPGDQDGPGDNNRNEASEHGVNSTHHFPVLTSLDKDGASDPDPFHLINNTGPLFSFSFEIKLQSNQRRKTIDIFRIEGRLNTAVQAHSNPAISLVKFTELNSEAQHPGDHTFTQYHTRVAIDSGDPSSYMSVIQPMCTPGRDNERLESSEFKTTWTQSISAAIRFFVPYFQVTATGSRARESSCQTTVKQYDSQITWWTRKGAIWWGYCIDDPQDQCRGHHLRPEHLPEANFYFFEKIPPTKHLVEVASYWHISDSPFVQEYPQYRNIAHIALLIMPSHLSYSDHVSQSLVLELGYPLGLICDEKAWSTTWALGHSSTTYNSTGEWHRHESLLDQATALVLNGNASNVGIRARHKK